MNIKILMLSAVTAAALLLAGCSKNDTVQTFAEPAQQLNETVKGEDNFYYTWQGEKITAETAEKNNCLLMGDDTVCYGLWQDFLINVASSTTAEVTVCTENSVMLVSESESGSTALIQIKEKDGDRIVTHGKVISPVEVSCVKNEESGMLEYYLSDCLLYTTSAAGESTYDEVPTEFSSEKVSSDAAVTFPYQKCFTSYTDFEKYYDMYHENMGLDAVKAEMDEFQAEGGFNDHVVFLYGDMTNGDAEYDFLRAVEEHGGLTVYLRKRSIKNSGAVSKWQLICTVQGQYLSNTAPDAVRWVIYEDEESRG